jgi:SAM-dependent MidA family methyltransferase
MASPAKSTVVELVRDRGPITIAEFMELALYHPEAGYYATAPRRSGRSGDFFTNVDVGPLFGEMVAVQIAEIATILERCSSDHFDLVEVGAGDGRLAKDILDTLERDHAQVYSRVRLALVERSERARQAQRQMLAAHATRVTSLTTLPTGIDGVVLANELLDALPVHVAVATDDGLREVYVSQHDGRLCEALGPVSSPAVTRRVEESGIDLESGHRYEAGLAVDDWIAEAGAALHRGFLLIFDYFRGTAAQISPKGTLTAYLAHTADAVHYLASPGACDLTTHVDLDALRRAAAAAGLTEVGAVDQTYFLTALGITERLNQGFTAPALRRRLAARTLIAPEGLGGTIKALAFSTGLAGVGLQGFASGRLT